MHFRAYIFIATTFLCLHSNGQCYWPDGSDALNLIPCGNPSDVTHCCAASDICLFNGLCFSPGLNSVLRRGCSSKEWNGTSCPNYCTSIDFNGSGRFDSAEAELTPCGSYNYFACGQNQQARDICNEGNDTLKIPRGDLICNDNTIFPCNGTISATVTTTSQTSDTPTPSSLNCSTVSESAEELRASLNKKSNIVTGLAVALGCAGVALLIVVVLWLKAMQDLRRGRVGRR